MNLLTLAYRLAVQNVKYGQIRLPLAKRMREYRDRERIIEEQYMKLFVLWDVMPDETNKNLREMLYRYGKTGSFIGVLSAAGEAGGRKYVPTPAPPSVQKQTETPRPPKDIQIHTSESLPTPLSCQPADTTSIEVRSVADYPVVTIQQADLSDFKVWQSSPNFIDLSCFGETMEEAVENFEKFLGSSPE